MFRSLTPYLAPPATTVSPDTPLQGHTPDDTATRRAACQRLFALARKPRRPRTSDSSGGPARLRLIPRDSARRFHVRSSLLDEIGSLAVRISRSSSLSTHTARKQHDPHRHRRHWLHGHDPLFRGPQAQRGAGPGDLQREESKLAGDWRSIQGNFGRAANVWISPASSCIASSTTCSPIRTST